MAFLTIAGVDYDVQITGAHRPERIKIGAASRAFAGSLRSTVRAEKKVYEFRLAPMSQATAATLKANTANGAFVTVTGTLIESGPFSAQVTITDDELYFDGSQLTTALSIITLRVEEV